MIFVQNFDKMNTHRNRRKNVCLLYKSAKLVVRTEKKICLADKLKAKKNMRCERRQWSFSIAVDWHTLSRAWCFWANFLSIYTQMNRCLFLLLSFFWLVLIPSFLHNTSHGMTSKRLYKNCKPTKYLRCYFLSSFRCMIVCVCVSCDSMHFPVHERRIENRTDEREKNSNNSKRSEINPHCQLCGNAPLGFLILTCRHRRRCHHCHVDFCWFISYLLGAYIFFFSHNGIVRALQLNGY